MSQYRVYRFDDERLYLDLQSDRVDTFARVVAPLELLEAGGESVRVLEPVLFVAGRRYRLQTAEMTAVPKSLLTAPVVADMSDYEYAIVRAIDYLFRGS